MPQRFSGIVLPFSTLDKTRIFIRKDDLNPLSRRTWELLTWKVRLEFQMPGDPDKASWLPNTLGVMEVCFVLWSGIESERSYQRSGILEIHGSAC